MSRTQLRYWLRDDAPRLCCAGATSTPFFRTASCKHTILTILRDYYGSIEKGGRLSNMELQVGYYTSMLPHTTSKHLSNSMSGWSACQPGFPLHKCVEPLDYFQRRKRRSALVCKEVLRMGQSARGNKVNE